MGFSADVRETSNNVFGLVISYWSITCTFSVNEIALAKCLDGGIVWDFLKTFFGNFHAGIWKKKAT